MIKMRNPVLPLLFAAAMGASALPAMAGPKDCPPGLAKKAVPCVPPGQVRTWQIGERIPGTTPWFELRDYDRYDLPAPPDGSRYVRIDNDLVRVAIATGVIVEYLGRF
jgi:hypothetical protein